MLKLLKRLFSREREVVNIKEEFKKRFAVNIECYTEFKTSYGKIWITHQFVDESYAKVYVIKDFKGYTPLIDKKLKYYVASITIQAKKPIYYEVFWEEL